MPELEADWPRRQATILTLALLPIGGLPGIFSAVVTQNPAWLLGCGVTLPWAWAVTRLVRFMLTGEEDWSNPWRSVQPAPELAPSEPGLEGQLERPA